jgi:multiple sugar transport system permease protein
MKHGRMTPYWFVMPAVIGFLVFRGAPLVGAVYASFTSWNIRTPPQWVGLANYEAMFSSPTFWAVFRNTVYFALIFVPGTVLLAMSTAVVLNQKLRGMAFFRGLYFLPYITAMVAVAMAWNFIFATRFGILNFVLTQFFGVENPPAWLASSTWALPAIAIVSVWKNMGLMMLIYLAALQNLPPTLYEAASVDGASKWKQFTRITVPLLTPATFFVLVITLIEAFKTFEVTFVMTQGGPQNSSNTLAYSIYENAFVFNRMGYASALAMSLLIGVAAVTLILFRIQKTRVHYDVA